MSNDEFVLGAGQAHELELAFRRTGWSNGEVKVLSMGNNLQQVREFVLGRAELKVVKRVIDCDSDPFIPNGWQGVEQHTKGGMMEWDPTKVKFYLSKDQQGGKTVKGDKLRKELASQPVMNANVLDYLLANTALIPEEWKKDESGNTRYIFFWGTIYRHSGSGLCVRCLSWHGGQWFWLYRWLDDEWDGSYPAALRAS